MFSRGISIHLHLHSFTTVAGPHPIHTHLHFNIVFIIHQKTRKKQATTTPPTVDGSEILHQLSLVVYDPIIYKGFYTHPNGGIFCLGISGTCHPPRFLVPIMCFPQDTVYLAPRSCCSLSPLVNKKYPPDAVERSRRGHRNVSGGPGWAWNLQCSNLVGAVKVEVPLGENPGGVPGPQIKHGEATSGFLVGKTSSWKLCWNKILCFWRVKKNLATKILK